MICAFVRVFFIKAAVEAVEDQYYWVGSYIVMNTMIPSLFGFRHPQKGSHDSAHDTS